MRLIDEGIQLEMNLKSMSREELERAYIEAKENEAVYKKFYNCVRKMMIAKLKKKPFVPKKWIERLDIPEMTCEYNADQWSVVCKLKSELEEIAIALGFKNEVICKTAHCRRRKQQIIFGASAPADCAVSVLTAVLRRHNRRLSWVCLNNSVLFLKQGHDHEVTAFEQ